MGGDGPPSSSGCTNPNVVDFTKLVLNDCGSWATTIGTANANLGPLNLVSSGGGAMSSCTANKLTVGGFIEISRLPTSIGAFLFLNALSSNNQIAATMRLSGPNLELMG